MGNRRRHLFVLLFVLGLVVVSAPGHRHQADQARPRPARAASSWSTRASRPARSRRSAAKTSTRSIEIIRERIDKLGVSEPEVSRLGTTEISVSLPDVTNAAAGDRPGRHDRPALLLRLGAEPDRAARRRSAATRASSRRQGPLRSSRQDAGEDAGRNAEHDARTSQLVFAGAFPTAYDAAQLASEQKPVPDCTNCSTSQAALLPVREGRAARPDRRPGDSQRRTSTSRPTGKKRPHNGIVLEVPPGTDRRLRTAERLRTAQVLEDGRARLVRAATTSRRSRAPTSPTRSRNFDEFGQPNVTFGFTDNGPRRVPGSHPQDRPARPGAGDRPGQRRSRPKRSPATSRSSSTTKSRRGRSSTSPRTRTGSTAAPAPRSPAASTSIERGPGPGDDPADRRPADQPEADQPDAGLGDARRAGARRRASRPGSSAWRWSSSSCSLFYRFLGLIALDRARRLRGDLLRPDQTDPDHPDPAGDRRPGPDDRGRGRLQHRHLRANKGGGAGRAIDVARDRRRLQTRDRDDHRRERRHPADRVHPLRAGDRRGQGVRLHPRRRHDRLAADRGRLHPGAARQHEPLAAAALARRRSARRAERASAGTSTSWAPAAGSSRSRG